MREIKIKDLVKLNRFPYENDIFMIVGDKETSWFKMSPYKPNGEEIKVENGKDFILIKKRNETFGIFGIPENGLHVNTEEIELI